MCVFFFFTTGKLGNVLLKNFLWGNLAPFQALEKSYRALKSFDLPNEIIDDVLHVCTANLAFRLRSSSLVRELANVLSDTCFLPDPVRHGLGCKLIKCYE